MAGFALALEIGGTKLQVALGARDGCIEKRVRGKAPADASADRVMAWFEDHVPSLIQSAQHDGKSITGIGIARRSLGCIRWNA